MSKTEKLEVLNALRVTNGQKALKGWKQSNEKLDSTIKALRSDLAAKGKDAPESPNVPVTKGKSETFVGVIRPLIHDGLTNKEIFDKVSGKRPGFFNQEKKDGTVVENGRKWHIAWHRADMIRKGDFTPKS